MSNVTADRIAPTDHAILEILETRWSTRAFDDANPIDEATLSRALEAARWTPSANNTQPWRFIVARRGTAAHAQISAGLAGFNATWAPRAAVLIIALVETETEAGDALPFGVYDLGQAVAHLSVQAHADGLFVHQMGGFDREGVREAFDVPARFTPFTAIALGEIGDAASLSEGVQQREVAPRERRPQHESVLSSH